MCPNLGKNLAIMVFVGGVFAACTPLPPFPASPPDASPAYKTGKFDGCEWGYMEAGRDHYTDITFKDVKRIAEDADYGEGWQVGFDMCFEEGSRYLDIMPGGGPSTP